MAFMNVLTHAYIIPLRSKAAGNLTRERLKARERGVLVDTGHGNWEFFFLSCKKDGKC